MKYIARLLAVVAAFALSGQAVAEHITAVEGQVITGAYAGNTNSGNDGGVVYGDANYSINDASFTGNTGQGRGGAVYHFGGALSGNNIVFTGNTANDSGGQKGYGGAIYNESGSVALNNVSFYNNTSGRSGGAIFHSIYFTDGNGWINPSPRQLFSIGSGAIFDGNIAGGGGGAIANQNQMSIGDNAVFNNNSAAWYGGAILNTAVGGINPNYPDSDPSLVTLTVGNNAKFTGNNSPGAGGAIYSTVGTVNIGSGALFQGNTSAYGGAIYNGTATGTDSAILNFASGAQFVANVGSTAGGAIVNDTSGIINFNGDVSFSGNKAAGLDNDIANNGVVNFNSGLAAITGGITGTGTVNVNNSTVFDIGLSTVSASAINFAGGSTLQLGLSAASNGVLDGTVTANGAKMLVLLGSDFTTGTKTIFTSAPADGFTIANNSLVSNFALAGTDLSVTAKTQTETNQSIIANGGNGNDVNVLGAYLSCNSFNDTSALIQTLAQVDAPAAVAAATAVAPDASSSRQSVSTGNVQQIFSSANNRMSAANGSNSSYALSNESFFYADSAQTISFWTQGLINKTHKETTSTDPYSGNTTGLAAGIDTKLNDETIAGLGYAYTHTNVSSPVRHTRVNGDNFFAYAQYQPGAFFVNATLNYGDNTYTENKYLPGMQVDAIYTVNTYSAAATAGYDVTEYLTPKLGFNYMNLQQEGYNDTSGQSVSAHKGDYFTGILGADFKYEYEASPTVRLMPMLNLGLTYDFISDDSESTVTLPNNTSYSVSGERLDRLGFNAGAGVSALLNENMEIYLSYDGLFKNDFSSHTGMLKLRYMF